MTKALAVLAAVAFGLSLSMSAGAADKTLAEIHGSAWPKSMNGYVVKEQCKACHGDYSKLAKMTENLDPNPHHSHLGDVNCTDCHKPDQEKPQLVCNQCHKFTIREKKTAAK